MIVILIVSYVVAAIDWLFGSWHEEAAAGVYYIRAYVMKTLKSIKIGVSVNGSWSSFCDVNMSAQGEVCGAILLLTCHNHEFITITDHSSVVVCNH